VFLNSPKHLCFSFYKGLYPLVWGVLVATLCSDYGHTRFLDFFDMGVTHAFVQREKNVVFLIAVLDNSRVRYTLSTCFFRTEILCKADNLEFSGH